MRRFRRNTVIWAALAIAGLIVAVGVSYAASQLAKPTVGLTNEPLSAGAGLSPAPTATTATQQAKPPTRKRHRKRNGGSSPTATAPAPGPAPAPAQPAAPAPVPAPAPAPRQPTRTQTTPRGDDYGGPDHGRDDSGGGKEHDD